MLKKAEIQQRISALHAGNMQRNHLTVEKVLDDLEHEKTRVLATQGLLVNRILNPAYNFSYNFYVVLWSLDSNFSNLQPSDDFISIIFSKTSDRWMPPEKAVAG